MEIDDGGPTTKAIAALRSILGLSIAEVSALKRTLPGPVSSGAWTKMDLAERLSHAGVTARLVLLEAGTGPQGDAPGDRADVRPDGEHRRVHDVPGADLCRLPHLDHCICCAFDVVPGLLSAGAPHPRAAKLGGCSSRSANAT